MKILLVSPNQASQQAWSRELARQQFVTDLAADAEEAWGLLQTLTYDLALLETRSAEFDGVGFCRRLRSVGNPILILLCLDPSVQGSDSSILRTEALNSGADACLFHPLQMSEILAQIQALARRGGGCLRTQLTWGPLVLDPIARTVTCHRQPLTLNRKEYQILELFLRSPRQMFSRRTIGERLWGLDESLPTDATIKSHIRNLRRKFEQADATDVIETHYGQGYRLNSTYDFSPGHVQPVTLDPESPTNTITAEMWQCLMAANAQLQQEVEYRQTVEHQLRRAQAMLCNAQRAAQVGCWEFDVQTREVYWTEELFLIHGLDPSQPTPSVDEGFALIHPDDRWIYEAAIRKPALNGEAFEANLRIIRANDGAVRHINARGGPIRDSAGNLIRLTGTTLDVTRLVQGRSGPTMPM